MKKHIQLLLLWIAIHWIENSASDPVKLKIVPVHHAKSRGMVKVRRLLNISTTPAMLRPVFSIFAFLLKVQQV